ncbi:MAG: DUF4236 domain-containing protein [Ruminococcus sp.]|nr:DUF4236 domain-containing protein [Ruminococcus sp.]NLT09773.1 DUF4236 domain-containing protein [Ruminococcus sp.]
MGFKFTKSIKLGKLFRLNVNKKSKSVTVGGKKLKVTLNDKKKVTASIPGTGISYDTKIDGKKK